MHLKMQTQLQQQKLLEDFQVRQQQINEEYEHRLKLHLKELWEQQQAQQARERQIEQMQLRQQRQQKHNDQQSHGLKATCPNSGSTSSLTGISSGSTNSNNAASSEVKQKLQVFLMKKREQAREMTNGSVSQTSGGSGAANYRNWGVVKSSSGESLGSGPCQSTHPYRLPGSAHSSTNSGSMISTSNSNSSLNHISCRSQQSPTQAGPGSGDFPLRKTASEPNLLKVRLKQRVIERRAGPMSTHLQARARHERLLAGIRHRKNPALANCAINNSPESGPNSPPALASRGSPTSAPIQEENEEPNSSGHMSGTNSMGGYGVLTNSHQGSLTDLSLFSSPSMPNISLGRSHIPHHSQSSTTEAAVLAAVAAARLGAPLTGQLLSGVLPYYPTLPVIEAEQPPEAAAPAPTQLPHHQQQPITDAQVAHHHLNKLSGHPHTHRPLGRTQSAPLPLGHPMLQGNPTRMPQAPAPPQPASHGPYNTQMDHTLLKQHIRQTVLTRAAGIQQQQQQQMMLNQQQQQLQKQLSSSNSSESEIIDLTEKSRRARLRDEDAEMVNAQDTHSALRPRPDPTRPLSRTLSSPLVHVGRGSRSPEPLEPRESQEAPYSAPTTGLAYDSIMLKHACRCGDNSRHPEHGGRLQSVWARLLETGLAARCSRLRARKATLDELRLCHTEAHTLMFGTSPFSRHNRPEQIGSTVSGASTGGNGANSSPGAGTPVSLVRLRCGGVGADPDSFWSDAHTGPAARTAAGCVIDLAHKTWLGETKNGFAVVRPPGHHAEPDLAMGFCFFNSVAIAAECLKRRCDLQRILIVDWDVHHGNGTQQMFYDDRRVLYISIHRHDDGNFFPGTGGPTECGAGEGVGFNVNIAWSGGIDPPLSDAEYLAAFRTVVMPIAKEFNPELILVSCGFDASVGHPAPLGGYQVSAACFGEMTRQLMTLANGKVVLSLEGGYDLPAICDSAQACVSALLGDEVDDSSSVSAASANISNNLHRTTCGIGRVSDAELARPPCQNAIDTLQKTIAIQLSHWPCVKRNAHMVSMCHAQALQLLAAEGAPPLTIRMIETKEMVEDSETVTAMAGLSMRNTQMNRTSDRSRSVSDEPMEQDETK
ncbi:histone deacetylase 9-like isoform X2 [Ctenocephalides felis]|uniref:histone deacetylase 9-like isoform X2 n=1 Tax=Ctenocephalides felis TaxID=7515 RepID=UPI000E6E3CDB|nr:histone deacetylase 9-like isoform X2 [Ctenocephalides felis]